MRLCNFIGHKWGRWDWWLPLFERQARHCMRCKLKQTRDL